MANRDRSQGFSFVYVNLAELLSKKDVSEDGPIPTFDAKVVHLNRDPLFTPEKPPTTETVAPLPARTPVEQIRENLDRLQSLHHRIHVMLEELSQISGKKKPKGD